MRFFFNTKLLISVVAISFCIMLASLYYSLVMLPIIKSIATEKVRSYATAAVNNAVFYALTEKSDYKSLVTIYSDNAGNINLIQADSVKINTLARETSKYSQDSINKIGELGIDLPLGTLTGSELIVGQGPLIHFKTVPVGTVNADFYSEFSSAGINQTRHRIYIIVEAKVVLLLPMRDLTITTDTQILVSENILVGEVPETYLKLNDEGLYNLLPNSLTN